MVINYFVKIGMISKNDICFNTVMKDKKTNIDVLSPSDFKKLYRYLTDNFNFLNLGILIAMNTGLRIGEMRS